LDELTEPLNSGATHLRLIESGAKVVQTPFITGRERDEAPNQKRRIPMKSMKAIALAATILTSTLGAFPKHASAAVNAYLIVDGLPGPNTSKDGGQPTPPPAKTWDIISIVISVLLG
jgi:hypothetical protein